MCFCLVFSSLFSLKEVFGEVFSHGHAGHMNLFYVGSCFSV